MSVVPMKLLTITGPADSIDDVICTCLVNELFHPVEAGQVYGSNQLLPFAWSNVWKEPLGQAEGLLESMEIPPELRDFRASALTLETVLTFLEETREAQQAFFDARDALRLQIENNRRDVEDLEKFSRLSSSLEDIYQMDYVSFRFGRMPREAYDSLLVKEPQLEEIILNPTKVEKEFAYLVYITPKTCAARSDGFMNSLGFERMRLTARADGTAEETSRMLEEDTLGCQSRLEALERAHREELQRIRDPLLTAYSYIRFMYCAGEIKKYAVYTGEDAFLLCGWVPEEELPRMEDRFRRFPEVDLTEEASVKGETPPVLLKNNFWGRLFQPFTEMYGLPAYNEFDPTFLMAVTYSILFGIMYGDVGQGLVLIALGVFLYKKKGMWLGGVLGSVGVFSTIFGFVFGSVFGYEELIPGFHVLASGDNATRILIVSAAIGAVLIVLMMGVNIYNGVRQKDFRKIFFRHSQKLNAGTARFHGQDAAVILFGKSDCFVGHVANEFLKPFAAHDDFAVYLGVDGNFRYNARGKIIRLQLKRRTLRLEINARQNRSHGFDGDRLYRELQSVTQVFLVAIEFHFVSTSEIFRCGEYLNTNLTWCNSFVAGGTLARLHCETSYSISL